MSDSQTAKPRRSVRAIVPQKIGSFAKGGSEEWEVPVWQMVRIMVQLEKNSSGKNTSLWRANQESWTELDQALTDTDLAIICPPSSTVVAKAFGLVGTITGLARLCRLHPRMQFVQLRDFKLKIFAFFTALRQRFDPPPHVHQQTVQGEVEGFFGDAICQM